VIAALAVAAAVAVGWMKRSAWLDVHDLWPRRRGRMRSPSGDTWLERPPTRRRARRRPISYNQTVFGERPHGGRDRGGGAFDPSYVGLK